MGKGARIRTQRREEEARRDAEPDIRTLVEALEPIASPAQFEALVNRRPALFSQAMLDYLRELARDPNIERFVSRFQNLVERARREPAGHGSPSARRWTRRSGKGVISSRSSSGLGI
jgi:hypothetical protein